VDNVCYLPATALVGLLRRGELSPVELLNAFLDRIDRIDPKVNAYCTVDRAGALDAAKRAEAELMNDVPVGPLHGIPIAVKDLLFTRGLRTTGGSSAYRDFVPDSDDVAVERARSAGAVILGKTNVPVFGFGPGTQNELFGITRNPWDLGATPGGSSGGSAAAVAAGLAPLALGTDAGGSVRQPASFCGIVGLKPTFGLVPQGPSSRDPRYPGLGASQSLSHVGPMARTVADTALLLDVIAGLDTRDRYSAPRPDGSYQVAGQLMKGIKIAVATTLDGSIVDSAVVRVLSNAAEAFESLGAEIIDSQLTIPDLRAAYSSIVASEIDIEGLTDLEERHPGSLNSRLLALIQKKWTLSDLNAAYAVRSSVYQSIVRQFLDCQLLLTPTVPILPHRIGEEDSPLAAELTRFTMPFNLTGNPAISIPAGFASSLPVGVQLVAPRFQDRLLLHAARAFESATGMASSWPPTST
jgi:aspartyl-tRNA(Asn)/glutamyl-tRNA(Gln) amidotransferase subunit A